MEYPPPTPIPCFLNKIIIPPQPLPTSGSPHPTPKRKQFKKSKNGDSELPAAVSEEALSGLGLAEGDSDGVGGDIGHCHFTCGERRCPGRGPLGQVCICYNCGGKTDRQMGTAGQGGEGGEGGHGRQHADHTPPAGGPPGSPTRSAPSSGWTHRRRPLSAFAAWTRAHPEQDL